MARNTPVRRLLTLALTAVVAIATGCVVARADGMPPSALEAQGVCLGLRGAGTDHRRPIAVTAIRDNGETLVFRCDPIGDGEWLPPVSRTVQWQ